MVEPKLISRVEIEVKYSSQEVIACFMSASVADCLPSSSFLRGSNRWRCETWTVGREVHKFPVTSLFCSVGPNYFCIFGPKKKHLADKQYMTDTDVKQTVTLADLFRLKFVIILIVCKVM
jgi:hypothetical protein